MWGTVNDRPGDKRLRWTADPLDPGDVLDALRPSDVFALYQPIVRLSDGSVFAHEALGRCRWERFKVVTQLVDAAVRVGRMGRIGRMLREAAAEGAPDALPLFFNVHVAELEARWLVRPDDPMILRSAPVFVEITETAAIQHFEVAKSVLGELVERAGVRIVVDDLGAGHSDLERVQQLRPSVIKVDRAIVQGLPERDEARRFVDEALRAAAAIGAQVVAEGIETEQEASIAAVLGIELGQGYYFGRPAALGTPAETGTEKSTSTTVSPSSAEDTRKGNRSSSS